MKFLTFIMVTFLSLEVWAQSEAESVIKQLPVQCRSHLNAFYQAHSGRDLDTALKFQMMPATMIHLWDHSEILFASTNQVETERYKIVLTSTLQASYSFEKYDNDNGTLIEKKHFFLNLDGNCNASNITVFNELKETHYKITDLVSCVQYRNESASYLAKTCQLILDSRILPVDNNGTNPSSYGQSISGCWGKIKQE